MANRVVIVGASLAGVRAARSLRRNGHSGAITLLGDERHFPPYDRPPLSKDVLLGKWNTERGRLDVRELKEVDVRLKHRADSLDPRERVVTAGGRAFQYDGLIVATGAVPRTFPAPSELSQRLLVLRTLDDSLALQRRLAPGSSVVIIGAGFLGCEIAAAAAQLGCHVSLVDQVELPMLVALGSEIGALVADVHQENGVKLRLSRSIASMVSGSYGTSPDAVRVVLDDESEIAADTVVVAIGARPATDWLEGAGLALNDGVLCDQHCMAIGAENIAAAGDVARWRHPLLRTDVRVEHWTNAAMQADIAAQNLLAQLEGRELRPYEALPYFWTNQYGLKLQFVGSSRGTLAIEEGSLTERRFVGVFRGADGRLVGGVCVNRPDGLAKITAAVRESLLSGTR